MQPWTRDEEVKIVELLRSGMSIDNIAMKSARTKEEIDKKIKQIIYENIISGKKIDQVAKLLKLPEEQVKVYFDSYRNYIKMKELKKETPSVNINEKIEILERENRFIKSILENRMLKKKLNELINAGLISENIKTVISNLRNNKL